MYLGKDKYEIDNVGRMCKILSEIMRIERRKNK